MIPGVLRLPDPVARRFPVDLTGMLHQKSVLFWIILYINEENVSATIIINNYI